MKMSIDTKTNLKRTALIASMVVLIILVIIGYFFGPKERKEVEQEVKINPVFQEIPISSFPAVSGLSFADNLILNTSQINQSLDYPKTANIYKIATFSATRSTLQGAKDIASEFGFLSDPSDLTDIWQFEDEISLLFVKKTDLSWDLEWGVLSDSVRTYSKDELIQKSKSFLQEKSFWKSVLNEAAVTAVGYDDTGVVLGEPLDPNNPDLWILSWILEKDELPIYGSSDELVVTIIITKFGEIKKIHYNVSDIEFEVLGTYPAISLENVAKSLADGKGNIVEASEPGKFYSSVTGEITEFSVQQIDMIYYQDTSQGFLVPVTVVTGQAKTDNGKYCVLTVWISAVSPEWLK